MQIVDHRFNGCWAGRSPNSGGKLASPTLLVVHFTASGGADGAGDVAWFMNPAAKASAHLIVGRHGAVRQVVPFDTKAWHAGASTWHGRANCNDYSIGIELDNWGRLMPSADGKMRSWTGTPVDAARAVRLRHKHEQHDSWWESFPPAQMDAAADAARALFAAYPSLGDIVGHDDIAPGRKVDPGPAFPMSRFTALVQGRGNVAAAA